MFMNCNERQSSCTRQQARPSRGCPNCEFTIQYKIFLAELEKELRSIKGTQIREHYLWDKMNMLRLVKEIASISAQAGEGYNDKWTEMITTLVNIYRNESSKKEVIDNWNIRNKAGETT